METLSALVGVLSDLKDSPALFVAPSADPLGIAGGGDPPDALGKDLRDASSTRVQLEAVEQRLRGWLHGLPEAALGAEKYSELQSLSENVEFVHALAKASLSPHWAVG